MAFENPIMVRTETNTQQMHGHQTTENLKKGHVVNCSLKPLTSTGMWLITASTVSTEKK
jgi:ribosomal protein S17